MSTTSRQTINNNNNGQQPLKNYFQNNNQPRNFISEELYHTNTTNDGNEPTYVEQYEQNDTQTQYYDPTDFEGIYDNMYESTNTDQTADSFDFETNDYTNENVNFSDPASEKPQT